MYITYNDSFYNRHSLRYYAKLYLRHLPKRISGLLTQGSSGCAIASAMMVLSKKKRMIHTHIRKSSEKAHTKESCWEPYAHYAIVDDFIDRGNTVLKLLEAATRKNIKVKCIVVCHLQASKLGDLPELRDALRARNIKLIQVEPYDD